MPLPWETDWSTEGRKESPPDKQPKQQKPWEVDWSTASPKAPRTVQKQPTIDSNAQGNANTLESVFKKLLVAESGSKHKDEAGNLITSKVGAQGISQLMPSTAKKPGYGITPVKDDSEEEYLRVGREYLSAMYNKYKDWEKALAAYNAGTGNVDKAIGKAERYEGDWKEFLPKPKETLPYIEKILGKPKERISALNIPPEKIKKGQSAGQMVENVKQTAYDIASMTPVVGDAMSLVEAVKSFKNKEYAEAGLNALGVLPFIPSAAGVIRNQPYFHGTRRVFDKHEDGLIFLTGSPDIAGSYASGGGGQRGRAKTAFYKDMETDIIYEQQGEELVQVTGKGKGKRLPADTEELQDLGIYPTEDWDKVSEGANIVRYYVDTEKTLNLMHKGYNRGGKAINEGADVLASIDSRGNRWAQQIINNAKQGTFDWTTTKYPEAQKAWKEILIPQLKEKGYDSIQYWDDMHETLAVFDNKSLMTTLPKKLATKSKAAQDEAINNLVSLLEKEGKTEEAIKLRELIQVKD